MAFSAPMMDECAMEFESLSDNKIEKKKKKKEKEEFFMPPPAASSSMMKSP